MCDDRTLGQPPILIMHGAVHTAGTTLLTLVLELDRTEKAISASQTEACVTIAPWGATNVYRALCCAHS
jgi:hypothetical protein